jgi:hypothetical protein
MHQHLRALAATVALLLACSGRSVGGDDGSSATTGTTETGSPNQDCQPILQEDGTPTGFEQCMPDDAVVRTEPVACSDPYPPSFGATCNSGYGVCSSDADCTDAAYGSCGYPADITGACHCEYGCGTDADCGAGRVCMCAPLDQGTRCIEADCQTDADCDPGYRCALSPGNDWSLVWPSLRCHGATDECQGDAACPDGVCRWLDSRWQCTG